MIEVIKINPHTREVKAVSIDPNDLRSYYEAIACRTFDCVGIDRLDAIFCDDEALLQEEQPPAFELQCNIIFGIGLIVGCDDEGNSTAPKHSLEEIRKQVQFLGKRLYQEPEIYIFP